MRVLLELSVKDLKSYVAKKLRGLMMEEDRLKPRDIEIFTPPAVQPVADGTTFRQLKAQMPEVTLVFARRRARATPS